MREIRMLRTTWRKLETGLRDGLRHRKMAKASGQLRLPAPVATAPAFDPTGERRLETEPWRGVRHRHCESRRQQLPPIRLPLPRQSPTLHFSATDPLRDGLRNRKMAKASGQLRLPALWPPRQLSTLP